MKPCIILTIIFATFSTIHCRDQCESVLPREGLNWEKLSGSWFHRMFFAGGGTVCRRMVIADIDIEAKVAIVEFKDIVTYSVSPTFFRQDVAYFRWTDNPGIIHTGIRTGYKASPKFSDNLASKRKSLPRVMAELEVSRYVVAATDHSNYILFVQCKGGVPSVGISLKEAAPKPDVMRSIKQKLISIGLETSYEQFENAGSCKP